MSRYNQYKIRVNGIEKVYPPEEYISLEDRLVDFLTETKFNFNDIQDELHYQWSCRGEGTKWSDWQDDSVKIKRSIVLDFGYGDFTIDCED